MVTRIMTVIAVFTVVLFPVGGNGQKNNSETYRQLDLFGDVFERIRTDYVKEVGDEKLIESAINGIPYNNDRIHYGFNTKYIQNPLKAIQHQYRNQYVFNRMKTKSRQNQYEINTKSIEVNT